MTSTSWVTPVWQKGMVNHVFDFYRDVDRHYREGFLHQYMRWEGLMEVK